jgi:hypothetical protein
MDIIRYPEMLSFQGPIFLGGNTAKGVWQIDFADFMGDTGAVLIDTSRQDWNVTPPTPEEIEDHVDWEMDWLRRAPFVFICIPWDTKSPTVLLELGIAITRMFNHRTVVYIEPGYSHFVNAEAACRQENIPVYTSFIDAAKRMKDLFLTSTQY